MTTTPPSNVFPIQGGAKARPKKQKSAPTIISADLRANFEIGLDEVGQGWAVPITGPPIARQLTQSGPLNRLLTARYEATKGAAAGPSAAVPAINNALSRAEEEGLELDPSLRVAQSGRDVFVDLGLPDGSAICITPEGWSIALPPSNVVWKRTKLGRPLPLPVRGKNDHQAFVTKLREHLPPLGDDDLALALAWMVHSWLSLLSCPILVVRGPGGAAKTTAVKRLTSLVDPIHSLLAPPKDEEQWDINASGSRVLAFDNLGGIPRWLSDCLCRAVTGSASVKRALFTDSELSILANRRAVVLTGIDLGSLVSDLTQRLVVISLDPIDDEKRKTEAKVDAAWESDRPSLEGMWLDFFVAVLTKREELAGEIEHLPRMADYGLTLRAVDELLGTKAAERYASLGEELQVEVAEGDAVVQALVGFLAGLTSHTWEGALSDLLALITPAHPDKFWPTGPRGLSGRLTKAHQALQSVGITAVKPNESWKRDWTLAWVPPTPPAPAPAEATTGDDNFDL